MLFIYCTTRVKRAIRQLIIFWRVICQKSVFIGNKLALLNCGKVAAQVCEQAIREKYGLVYLCASTKDDPPELHPAFRSRNQSSIFRDFRGNYSVFDIWFQNFF